MTEHSKVAGVQRQACEALWRLSVNNDSNKIEIVAKGGIVAALAALEYHPTDTSIQRRVGLVLANLTNNTAAQYTAFESPSGSAGIILATRFPSRI